MSREIKFRVWAGTVMLTPDSSIGGELKENKLYDDYLMINPVNGTCEAINWSCEYSETKKSFILMEYTGLRDINGVEIYEGDIIRKGNFSYAIEWNDEQAMFGYYEGTSIGRSWRSNCYDSITDSEIIGNIYENPELTKRIKHV